MFNEHPPPNLRLFTFFHFFPFFCRPYFKQSSAPSMRDPRSTPDLTPATPALERLQRRVDEAYAAYEARKTALIAGHRELATPTQPASASPTQLVEQSASDAGTPPRSPPRSPTQVVEQSASDAGTPPSSTHLGAGQPSDSAGDYYTALELEEGEDDAEEQSSQPWNADDEGFTLSQLPKEELDDLSSVGGAESPREETPRRPRAVTPTTPEARWWEPEPPTPLSAPQYAKALAPHGVSFVSSGMPNSHARRRLVEAEDAWVQALTPDSKRRRTKRMAETALAVNGEAFTREEVDALLREHSAAGGGSDVLTLPRTGGARAYTAALEEARDGERPRVVDDVGADDSPLHAVDV